MSPTTFLCPSPGFFQNKINYALLIEIEVKSTHTLESFVGYWQHLNIAWPKQAQNFKNTQ
jgi:hypothetical protein